MMIKFDDKDIIGVNSYWAAWYEFTTFNISASSAGEYEFEYMRNTYGKEFLKVLNLKK